MKRNFVQSREFSAVTRVKERPGFQMLKFVIARRDHQHARARALPYHNRAIATQEVIEELIPPSQRLRRGRQARQRDERCHPARRRPTCKTKP